tara:strand:- start:583 stop:987 length:405 start_codon:yes stop_codon:yes gene_type:complete
MTKEKKKKNPKFGGNSSQTNNDKLELLLKKFNDTQKKEQQLKNINKKHDTTGTYVARRTIFWIGIICICLGVLILIYGIFKYMYQTFVGDAGEIHESWFNQNKIPSLMWKIVLGSSLMGVGLWMSFDLARNADL